MDILASHYGSLIRFTLFALIIAGMALWERLAPRRVLSMSRPQRWRGNFGIVLVDVIALRLIFPLAAVGAGMIAEEQGLGLFNSLALPPWFTLPISVLLLDLALYVQHVVFHKVPLLWQLHKVHHADLDIDFTTGIRFHPFEILLSMALKFGVIFLFGVSALSALLFEVLLNSTSLFNHGNIAMPAWLDRMLRRLLVTPDMHRVHHSVRMRETDSNFGFNLSIWDRLFGTYRDQPALGHTGMTIGIEQLREPTRNNFFYMLRFPFISSTLPRHERHSKIRRT